MEDLDVTVILERIRQQGQDCSEWEHRLVELLYGELRRMAGGLLRRERPGHTLQATALVHEAYLSLTRADQQWENRAHFFGAAAQAMRRILVMHARAKHAEKRGGDAERVTLNDLGFSAPELDFDVLSMDQAISALSREDPSLGKLIEIRFFMGCSLEEAAELRQVSLATVKRDWTYAKTWLAEYLTREAS